MKTLSLQIVGIVLVALFVLAGCSNEEPMITERTAVAPGIPASALQKSGTSSPNVLDQFNVKLAEQGVNYRAGVMEYIASEESGEYGITLFAKNVGNKQLGHHFVAGDPRRGGGVDITYITDYSEGVATGSGGGFLSADETTVEIDRAMAVWGNQSCSGGLVVTNLGAPNFDFGVVQAILGFGGVFGWAADVTHAGWLPKAFFDAIATNGGNFILGVTFTFLWVDGNGNFTDIDRDGKLDVAFREIYYNNNFAWRLGAWTGGNDFQAFGVILHEAGHGLSQGHFGQVFIDGSGNRVHFAPFAVMNAVVSRRSTVADLEGTDVGGHCSIWAHWPN